MNPPISLSADSAVQPIDHGHHGESPIPWRLLFWRCQGYVMIAVVCSSFFPALFRLQEHLIVILATFCIGMCWLQKESPWVKSPLDRPLCLFFLWVLFTVPFATDVSYSFAEWRKFLTYALVFEWALLVMRHSAWKQLPQWVLKGAVIGCALLSVYALTDFLMRGGSWHGRAIRAGAPGSDYNWLSTYMVLALPIVLSYIVLESSKGLRFAEFATVVLGFIAQAASYTRAGWVAHAIQGVALAILTGSRRLLLWVLLAFVTTGLGFLLLMQWGYQKDTLNPWTFDSRIAVWKIGLKEVLNHPLVGIGYGNNSFIKRFPQYAVSEQERFNEQERVLPSMHSAFLMVMVGSGLPGFVSFAWLFVALVYALIRPPTTGELCVMGALGLGVAIAVIGFGVWNLFDSMFIGSLSHLFWLLAAAGIAITNPMSIWTKVDNQ